MSTDNKNQPNSQPTNYETNAGGLLFTVHAHKVDNGYVETNAEDILFTGPGRFHRKGPVARLRSAVKRRLNN